MAFVFPARFASDAEEDQAFGGWGGGGKDFN